MSDRIEPPFNFEAVALDLLNESMRRSVCIRNGRGYCCDYHQGFEDGMDELMTRFEQWMPKASDD
jgi:hypothetical protein